MTIISILLFLVSGHAEDSRFMRGVNQCLKGTPGFISVKQGVVFCSPPNTITAIYENSAGQLRTQHYVLKGKDLEVGALNLELSPLEPININAQFEAGSCKLKIAEEKGLKTSPQGAQLTDQAAERLALRMKGELLSKNNSALLASADHQAWFRGCLENLKYVTGKFSLHHVLSESEEQKLRELVLPSKPGPRPATPAGALRE